MQPCTEAIVTPPAVFDQKDYFGCVEKANFQGSGCPILCLIYNFQQDSDINGQVSRVSSGLAVCCLDQRAFH